MITIKKTCDACNKEYIIRGTRSKLCGECAPDKSWYARWFNYGITKPQFEKMLEEQSGLCGLCFEALPDNLSFVYIDHCHTQGHVRALLHKDCNTGLGF